MNEECCEFYRIRAVTERRILSMGYCWKDYDCYSWIYGRETGTDKKTQEKVRKEMKKILDEQYERKRPISIVDKSSDEPPDSLADKKGKQE